MPIEEVYYREGRLPIELHETYTYNELRLLFEEERKKGGARESQKKNWGRFFEWTNPTTQKFVPTKLHVPPKPKIDGRASNGGAREGAGRPESLRFEFDRIIGNFLRHCKLQYKVSDDMHIAYFSNGEIARYFGLYRKGIFAASREFSEVLEERNTFVERIKDVERVIEEGAKQLHLYIRFETALERIRDKLNEKTRTLIFDKINRTKGLALGYGIVAHKADCPDEVEFHDEWLDTWDEYSNTYMGSHELDHLSAVAKSGNWKKMIEYVTSAINSDVNNDQGISMDCDDEGELCFDFDFEALSDHKYSRIEKVRRVVFNPLELAMFSPKEIEESKKAFNNRVADDVLEFVSKKTDDAPMCKYIVDKYVRN